MNTRWARLTGGDGGRQYAARFAELAAKGTEMHGEATFCAGLLKPPGRILDAGCGTGRVAIRLTELGYECVGVDADDSMLAVARESFAAIEWVTADLATLRPDDLSAADYELIVAAGNVIPLLEPGTLTVTVAGLASLLAPSGVLVTGFGLDADHLPRGCPVTPLEKYDAAAVRAGLVRTERFSTWDRKPFTGEQYAVSVHRREP